MRVDDHVESHVDEQPDDEGDGCSDEHDAAMVFVGEGEGGDDEAEPGNPADDRDGDPSQRSPADGLATKRSLTAAPPYRTTIAKINRRKYLSACCSGRALAIGRSGIAGSDTRRHVYIAECKVNMTYCQV